MKDSWKIIPFEDVCLSMTKGPFGSDIKKSLYVPKSESTYKVYIQANAIEKDPAIGDYYISKEYFDTKMFRFEVKPGDYIITCDGTLGKFIRLPQTIERGIISASLLRITLGDQIVPRYFEYLWDGYILSRLTKDIRNSALVHLPSASKIGKVLIPVPSISEQERIVAELDMLTGIIDKQKQQIKELDTLAQSIFYDMFGDPVENEKGWKKGCVSELCCPKKEILRASKSFSSSDVIEYIDISSIDNKKNIMTSTLSVVFSDAPSRAQQLVEKDDILVSLVRPNLKNIAVVNRDDDNLVASSGFCVLRHLPSISYEFLFYITKSEAFTEYLMQRISGANYPAVREEDIRGYFTIVPPLTLQKSFAQKVQSIESQKESINRSIAETQKLFDYTMDKYFG